MKTDDIEKRLQRQPQREIPAAWRAEILSNARNTVEPTHAPRPTPHGFLFFIHQLTTLLRPHRAAWAGLAAAWIVIFALNIAARDNSPKAQVSRASAPVSPETLQALKQQRLLLAELVGRPEPRAMDRPKAIAPGPRSQRREESATV